MSTVRSLPPSALLALLGLVLAMPLLAQEEPRRGDPGPTLVPFIGVQVPGEALLRDADRSGGWEGDPGLLYGIRIEVPLRARLSLVGDIGYATSPVEAFGTGREGFGQGDANFMAFSGRLAFQVMPERSPVQLALHVGGGLMRHWISSPGPRFYAWPEAVIGTQAGVAISRSMTLAFLAEGHLYSAKFDGNEASAVGQRDWRFGVGLKVPLQ